MNSNSPIGFQEKVESILNEWGLGNIPIIESSL